MDTPPYLPNDLLRSMPFSETVGTWPLNDTYIDIIQRLEGLWRQRGYTWAFGTEINFQIAEAPDAEELMVKSAKRWGIKNFDTYRRINKHQQGELGPYFAAHAALADKNEPFLKAIAEVEEMLDIQRRRLGYQPPHIRKQFEANERETRRIFKSYLHSDRTRRDHLKRANVFLAWLHIMPSACGGIADMVDMRFGNERHGRGWWDCGEDIELRFFNRGALDILQSYNRAHFLFFEACKRFGFIPRIRDSLSQLHFSVWQGQDRNLMTAEDEAAIDLRAKMTDGLMTASTFLPFMYLGSPSASTAVFDQYAAGATRLNSIRFCEDSWELRRACAATLTHLAQDVAYTLIGCSSSVLTDVTPATPNGGFITKRQGSIELEYAELTPFRHLRIHDRSDRKCAAIKSCLESAAVKDDGFIDVNMDAVYFNHELLVTEIGPGAVDRYTIVEDGYVLNLGDIEHAHVWHSLFSKIRYDRQTNTLDVTRLPKAVQAWFEPFEVTCLRTDFVQEARVPMSPEFIHRMASDFEQGVYRINHLPPEISVHLGNFFKTYVPRERVKDQIRACVHSALLEKDIPVIGSEIEGYHADMISEMVVTYAVLAGRMKDLGEKGLGVSENLKTANDFYLAEVAAYQQADAYGETGQSALFKFERDLYADRSRFFDLTKLHDALTKVVASHQRMSDLTLDGSDNTHVVEYIIHFCAFLKKDHAAACREAAWLKDNWLGKTREVIEKKRAHEATLKLGDGKTPFSLDLPTPEISEATYRHIDAAVRRACDALPAMQGECQAWAKKLPDSLEIPIVMQAQDNPFLSPVSPPVLRA